jgi:4-azaleucine resistance transporter AzlC
MKRNVKLTLKEAFKSSLPIFAGYIVLGGGFGILLAAKGYGIQWAFLMSLFIYAGSMQYVAIDLLAGGASLISSAIMTVMVQARHMFYGISMLDKYKDAGKVKPYLAFALTDETYSLVCSGKTPDGADKKLYWLFLSMLNQCYWILGCTMGNLFGNLVSFNSAGVEFSMTAIFIVIFVEQWQEGKSHSGALLGVGASFICLLIFGADKFLIPAMIVIAAVLCMSSRRKNKK